MRKAMTAVGALLIRPVALAFTRETRATRLAAAPFGLLSTPFLPGKLARKAQFVYVLVHPTDRSLQKGAQKRHIVNQKIGQYVTPSFVFIHIVGSTFIF